MRDTCALYDPVFFSSAQPNFDVEKTLSHIKTNNDIDRNEQISLFQRLLEIVIRHALKKKTDDKAMKQLDLRLMSKPGSEWTTKSTAKINALLCRDTVWSDQDHRD